MLPTQEGMVGWEQVNEIVAQQQNMSKDLDDTLEAYLAIHPRLFSNVLIFNKHAELLAFPV